MSAGNEHNLVIQTYQPPEPEPQPEPEPAAWVDSWDSGDVTNANGKNFTLYLLPLQPADTFENSALPRVWCDDSPNRTTIAFATTGGANGKGVNEIDGCWWRRGGNETDGRQDCRADDCRGHHGQRDAMVREEVRAEIRGEMVAEMQRQLAEHLKHMATMLGKEVPG